MADLKGIHNAINVGLESKGQKPLSEDELLIKLFEEVTYIWPLMGYPPLVTPFSQYVKNIALINVLSMSQGNNRFSMIDNNTWDMLLGKAGTLPGKLDPIFEKMAKEQNRTFYTGLPQDAFPNALDKYRKEMIEKGWDLGPDEEELFEFAMHETQYRDYKSGIAKQRFEEELIKVKTPKNTVIVEETKLQTRNTSYSKKEADRNTAVIALLLHSLNKDNAEPKCCCNENNIWKNIGYWRPEMEVNFAYQGNEFPVKILKQKNSDYTLDIEQKKYECSLAYFSKDESDVIISGECYNAKISTTPQATYSVSINGKVFELKRLDILLEKSIAEISKPVAAKTTTVVAGEKSATPQVIALKQDIEVKSPMPGKVFEIVAKEGTMVKKGDTVVIIESMKMENSVLATADAMVKKITVAKNDIVDATTTLFILGNNPASTSVKEEPKPVVAKPAEIAKPVEEAKPVETVKPIETQKPTVEVSSPKPVVEAPKPAPATSVSADEIAIKSPMPGLVFQILVKEGDTVKKGETLIITEFMKMENRVLAPKDAVVQKIFVTERERVETTTVMLTIK
jgi:biotin carboxyl carrier protein